MNREFYYENGELFHAKYKSWNARKGDRAGTLDSSGYVKVNSKGKNLYAHRIVWMLFKGHIPQGKVIDHINRDRSDNRIENLRTVSKRQNAYNTEAQGVTWDKTRCKWKAQIKAEGRNIFLGRFKSRERAINAYNERKRSVATYG